MIRLVPASKGHIPFLADTMRPADMVEVGALGKSPRRALDAALSSSLWALTALEDDVPVAMLGVTPKNMLASTGVPWMLGSDRIYDNARALVILVPSVVALMHDTFRTLENAVSVDNARAISFLRHWGWHVGEEKIEIGGVEFVRFYSEVKEGVHV